MDSFLNEVDFLHFVNALFRPENVPACKLYFAYKTVEAVAADGQGRGKINFETVHQSSFNY